MAGDWAAALRRAVDEAQGGGLRRAGDVIGRASDESVPVETGRLRGSRTVTVDEDTVTVAYGTDYAVPVHEDLQAHHPTGHAKFLETAVHSHGGEAVRALGDALRGAL